MFKNAVWDNAWNLKIFLLISGLILVTTFRCLGVEYNRLANESDRIEEEKKCRKSEFDSQIKLLEEIFSIKHKINESVNKDMEDPLMNKLEELITPVHEMDD